MKWDELYAVSRAVMLQIGTSGELMARGSLSSDAQVLAPDALPVLTAFARGRTPAEALARLQEEWEIEESGFTGVVDALLAQNLLTPVAGNAALAAEGLASPLEHFMMIRDTVRVSAYRRAIFRQCKDKMVVEIGCGSGILSIFAAKAGARRVIAIEESRIADLAAAMFEANGVADRVELRCGNSLDVSVDERADVIVHEVLGIDPFGENILPFIEDARERMLAPGGILIPSAMEVWCVGFEVPDAPYLDTARAAVELSELEGLFGVDFSAFRQYVTGHSEWFPRPLPLLGRTEFAPRLLTEPAQLYRIDFAPGSSLAVEPRKNARLRVAHAGTLGGVVVYFRAHLDDETFLGNAPWMPQTSWGWNARALGSLVPVQPGEEIDIVGEVSTVAGAQGLRIALASR